MIHSLHIGINNYRGTNRDLRGCVNDAQDLYALFAGRAATQKLLLDARASRAAVLRSLKELLARLQAKDLGIITFSGHGSYVADASGDEDDGRDEALVCADLRLIYDDEFSGLLSARDPASRLFVVTDSCHSGTAHRALQDGRTHNIRFLPAATITRVIGQPKRPGRERLTVGALPGVIHFSGCRDSEFSYGAEFAGRPQGALTHYLALAYRLLAVRTFGDWFEQLSQCLPSSEYPQTPCCNATKAALRWPVPKGKVRA